MSDETQPEEQPRFTWWVSKAMAASIGCTHHARFMGIIPGFIEPGSTLWVSRSDLLNPVEDAVVWLWMTLRNLRGEEPDFMFAVGREIQA